MLKIKIITIPLSTGRIFKPDAVWSQRLLFLARD